MTLEREEIISRINQVPYWRHRIDLGEGIVTPGILSSHCFDLLRLPEDLSGKSVLDIGAWDGYYSFEAERRGASRVAAVDIWYEPPDENGNHGSPIYLVKEILKSKVEVHNINVMDLSPDKHGMYDIVLFLGVLYHLLDPFLALRKIAQVARETVIVESHAIKTRERRPLMRFYENNELEGSDSNWWGPNFLCIEAMIRSAGFPRVEKVADLSGPERDRYEAGLPLSGYTSGPCDLMSSPNDSGRKIMGLPQGQPLLILSTAWCDLDFSDKNVVWFRVERVAEDTHVQGWLHGSSLILGQPILGRLKGKVPRAIKDTLKLAFGRPVNHRAIVRGYKK